MHRTKTIYTVIIFFILLSCTDIKSVTHHKAANNSIKDSLNNIAAEKGIDFTSIGNNPVPWKLNMDFDYYFQFNAGDSNTIKIRPTAPETGMHHEEIYRDLLGGSSLKITIFNPIDEKHNENPNNVIVDFKDNTYYGSGHFIYDKRLQKKWVLNFIDNEEQFPINYPNGMPYLKFDVDKNKMSGFDGRNKLSCDITIRGNRILFDEIYAVKASEKSYFSKLLNDFVSKQLVEFYYKDNDLVLQLFNDMRLRFRPE